VLQNNCGAPTQTTMDSSFATFTHPCETVDLQILLRLGIDEILHRYPSACAMPASDVMDGVYKTTFSLLSHTQKFI
jgi:hypothetical protein